MLEGSSRYGNREARLGSWSGGDVEESGLSVKRTDFGDGREVVGSRRDFFFAKEVDDVMRGLLVAWAKSLDSDGSFGCVIVGETFSSLWPWNWEESALYC